MQNPILDKESMIKWLGEVIDAELDKPDDEIDMALIMECNAYLAELMPEVDVTDEQIERNIASIMNKSCNEKRTSTTPRRTPRKRRLIAIICAVALAIGGTVSAYAFVPAFRDMVRNVLNLGAGASVDDGGITFTYLGRMAIYESLDELIQAENLNIMYFHKLPDGIKIKYVTCSGEGENFVCTITFADGMGSFYVEAHETDISKLSTSSIIYEANGISYYITDDTELYVAVATHNSWTYNVSTHNMELLKELLENLY